MSVAVELHSLRGVEAERRRNIEEAYRLLEKERGFIVSQLRAVGVYDPHYIDEGVLDIGDHLKNYFFREDDFLSKFLLTADNPNFIHPFRAGVYRNLALSAAKRIRQLQKGKPLENHLQDIDKAMPPDVAGFSDEDETEKIEQRIERIVQRVERFSPIHADFLRVVLEGVFIQHLSPHDIAKQILRFSKGEELERAKKYLLPNLYKKYEGVVALYKDSFVDDDEQDPCLPRNFPETFPYLRHLLTYEKNKRQPRKINVA